MIATVSSGAIAATERETLSDLNRETAEFETKTKDCEKTKKNWKTAAWIGGGMTAVGGTAAIILHNKASEKSKTLDAKNEQLRNLQ